MYNRIQDFKTLIAQGKVEKVINEMLTLLKNTEHEQVILLISQDFRGITSKALSGLITDEDERTQKTKITKRVLDLLGELSPNTLQSVSNTAADASSTTSFSDIFNLKKHWWKYVVGLGVLMGIFGGCSEALTFLGCNKSGSNNDNSSTQLTVFVGNEKDSLHIDKSLINKAKIIVDFDGDRRSPLIGENGRTNMGEIPTKFRATAIPLSIEADNYEATEPNKTYLMNGKPFYFKIKPKLALRTIEGTVRDAKTLKFLGGVRIICDGESALSDSLGYFKLIMPSHKQQERYDLTTEKKNYKTQTTYFVPNSTKADIRL